MKRRTNLFYVGNNIDESNFLTFSNYPEHLTGITLTSYFKIYPSRFLCVYIPSLNKETKDTFIKDYLVRYYENKLAFLRDTCNNEDIKDPDEKLRYLGYLIDAIEKFDKDYSIIYNSTIIEYNYDGPFSDIICTIDSFKDYHTYSVSISKNPINDSVVYDKEIDKLYGWESKVPAIYDEQKNLQFDSVNNDKNVYLWNSTNDNIIRNDEITEEIKFNVLIPLYDVINTDKETNETIIDEDFDKEIKLNCFDTHSQNIPYGIWFANEDIILKRANFKNYSPSWSLSIGVQFKPFPNSNLLTSDNRNDDKKIQEYQTFAKLMANQTKLFDELMQYKKNYDIQIQEKIKELESYKTSVEKLESTINKLEKRIDILEGNYKNNNTHTWVVR